ncbi:phosphatase 2C-like domain-containing protein [Aspergillus egyptiacus]|nr:phosphatase 2C-like domain-containing protein [Aspergillus egyptiacus]
MDGLASDSAILHAAGGATAQGSRPSQQDRHIIVPPDAFPEGSENKVALFAVFDGHGSHTVAKHAKDHLPRFLLESAEFLQGNYERGMQKAIEKEDRALFEEFKHGEDEYASSGSTVSIAVVDLTKGILVVGNLGDSHILLAERDTESGSVKSIDRLTKEHKPDDPGERQRIEEAGGTVHSQHNIWRIGALNMSRALGDLEYKNPLNNASSSPITNGQKLATGDPSAERDDFLSIKMSFKRVQLEKDKQYVVALTSDGVTNALEDKVIMHSVTHFFNTGMSAEQVARSLVEEATSRPGSDNATCIAVFLSGVEAAPK